MPAATPVVTVIVVSYNHAPYIDQALDAVYAQTHPAMQVVIMDDASSDDSADVIRSYLERTGRDATFVAHVANRGLCPTLNEALGLVADDAEFIAVIAADDWMEPNRLARQLERFEEAGPKVAVVHSDMYLVDEEGRRRPETYHPGGVLEGDLYAELVRSNPIAAPTALIRRAVRDEIGPYDEAFVAEDFDTWLRVAKRYEFAFVDEPLVNYRTLATSMSRSDGTILRRERWVRVLLKHLGERPELDDLIRTRVEDLVILMYLDGSAARPAARDLRRVVRVGRPRGVLYLVLASLGIPGRWVGSWRRTVRRALRR